MAEERSNLDYGRDDRSIEEVAALPNDDYLTMERVEEHQRSADSDPTTDDEGAGESDSPSTFGAP